ncbi:lipopolysaccharide biosynthesis protein [uncultured Bacteroides sp.]|uniref:lipopolysaccharide biosynthesis protein n=1 Tax=uncultured Bacteroides sp. TaxID=162156 RepID=UPI0025E39377|nr:lipopolysaccharide biosynthesis protein [uncultured Bacteroides sp.]
MENLTSKVATATKWSAMAEVLGKLIAPVSTMVLARVLTPEAFGVVATLTMIISFAEIFTDAGFQRYIIQHEFADEKDYEESTNVAFWSNLIMSLMIWGVISLFAAPLAALVGNPGLGHILIVSCVSIPIAALSSIQMAVFKRKLEFKALFYRRLVAVIIPLVVTIPLALWMRSYWALVIGTIVVNLSNALILTLQSPWKPKLYYNRKKLRSMISFSVWSMFDAILIWATSYIEIFFIGVMMSAYYLGLYKTSISTVGQFTSLITAAILPVIMPTLSLIQNDHAAMREMLLKLQKYVSVLLLPIGFGIFMFSKFVTYILLGNQWDEAVAFIGIWALMEVVTIVFSRFCSNIYPAIGKPKLSVAVQILHLVVLIPAIFISINYGFTVFFYTRSLIRLHLVIVNMAFAYWCIRMSPYKMILNVMPEFLACIVMCYVASRLLTMNDGIEISIIWIFICAGVYLCILLLFKKERAIINLMLAKLLIPIKLRLRIK